jgi:hypothetical protein
MLPRVNFTPLSRRACEHGNKLARAEFMCARAIDFIVKAAILKAVLPKSRRLEVAHG